METFEAYTKYKETMEKELFPIPLKEILKLTPKEAIDKYGKIIHPGMLELWKDIESTEKVFKQ